MGVSAHSPPAARLKAADATLLHSPLPIMHIFAAGSVNLLSFCSNTLK
jgi:hypothetical protein